MMHGLPWGTGSRFLKSWEGLSAIWSVLSLYFVLHIKLIICSLREGAGHRVLNPARDCAYILLYAQTFISLLWLSSLVKGTIPLTLQIFLTSCFLRSKTNEAWFFRYLSIRTPHARYATLLVTCWLGGQLLPHVPCHGQNLLAFFHRNCKFII